MKNNNYINRYLLSFLLSILMTGIYASDKAIRIHLNKSKTGIAQ